MTVRQYFDEHVMSLLGDAKAACGDLMRVALVPRGSNDEVLVETLDDEAMMYVDIGIAKAIFYVAQSDAWCGTRAATEIRDVANVLVRERHLQLPTWAHAGRPAWSQLFAQLRDRFEKDGVGFNGAVDLKIGCEWMLSLVKVLYNISPFHGKMKSRGHPVPDALSFSGGSNDFKKKGKSEPTMTQEILREVSNIVV